MLDVVLNGFKEIILSASKVSNALFYRIDIAGIGSFSIFSIIGVSALLILLGYQVIKWIIPV